MAFPILIASERLTLFAVILAVLLFLLAGGVVVVAYSGTKQGRPHALWRTGKRIFARLKSTKTSQNISAPRVEKKEEFMKWLADWRAGNQPNPTSIRRIPTEVVNGTNATGHAAAAKIANACEGEPNDSARTKYDFEKKSHAA